MNNKKIAVLVGMLVCFIGVVSCSVVLLPINPAGSIVFAWLGTVFFSMLLGVFIGSA